MNKYKKSISHVRNKISMRTIIPAWLRRVIGGEAKADEGYALNPLYPTIERKHHKKYVSTLNASIKDSKVKNVALTGDYGSGKSSVLEWFIEGKKKRVVRVSFATLGANIEKYITETSEDSKHKRLNTLSNLIQKEIIKQILFNDKPSKLIDSRYKRASKVNILSVLLLSLLIATVLCIYLYLTNFNTKIMQIAMFSEPVAIYLWITLALCTWLTVAVILFTIGSRIKIDQITGGPVSLRLTGDNDYFDEYLDEIIYYFEATKRDIVIIEDIDRFNTLYIFENLRQLNSILNNAKQIKNTVRFVYAVKDSIFVSNTFDDNLEDSGELLQKVVSTQGLIVNHKDRITNRTKFFDVIIPIVPFITYATSRNYIESQLGNDYDVSKKIVQLVSKHLVDMRLIKNICNEFSVFHNQVFKESNIKALNDESLFALIVYKNIHLDDFEKIKSGDSVLNDVDDARRAFIRKRLDTISESLDALVLRLSNLSSVADRSKQYGAVLLEYTNGVAGQLNSQIASYTFEGNTYDKDSITGSEFWTTLCRSESTSSFVVGFTFKNYNSPTQQTITKEFIASKLLGGVELDVKQWEEKDQKQIQREIATLKTEQKGLNHLSVADLMGQYEIFRRRVRELLDDSGLINSKLVFELYENGYIDSYYALYTSIYHSQGMSPKALNYSIQFIHRGEQDIFYGFGGDDDIEKMLADNGSYIGDKSMYNIEILDFLLSRGNDDELRKVLANLGTQRDNADEFIDAYMKSGRRKTAFIEKLTPYWSNIFTYIADSQSIRNGERLKLLNSALINGDAAKDYAINDSLVNFVIKEAKNIEALSTNIKISDIHNVLGILLRMKIRFPRIDLLNARIKQVVLDNNLYEINRPNLLHISSKKSLNLEVIREKESVYSYILTHIDSYLLSLKRSEFVLHGSAGYIEVLNDIADHNKDKLPEVITRSKSRINITDLDSLKASVWSPAIVAGIVDNNLTNALKYYDYGHDAGDVVDEILGSYLNQKGTLYLDKPYEQYEEETLKAFMLAVVNSEHVINTVKAQIVADCYTTTYLSVSDITPQEGDLYGLLRKQNCINDNADTINALTAHSWETRKAYFLHAHKLPDYIKDVNFSPEDIQGIANDEGLEDMKDFVIDRIGENIQYLSAVGAGNILAYAHSSEKVLSVGDIQALSEKTTSLDALAVVDLINRLPEGVLNKGNVLPVLIAMGGEYAKIKMTGIFAKRPQLEDTTRNRLLLDKLSEIGVVRQYRKIENGNLQVDRKT